MHWTEDKLAILSGFIILLIGSIPFLILPLADVYILELIDPLKAMSVKLDKWQYNPLDSFHLKWFGLFLLFTFLSILLSYGIKKQGGQFGSFIKGFAVVFLIAVLANLLGSQTEFKTAGLGYTLWAIVLGMVVSNVWGIPEWLKAGLKHEFFIKTGLVLLGAEVLFGKVLAIGLPGLFVAWVVTPIVLITTFWFGQRILKIGSKSLNITISADMSVCGVSAAIATAAASKAKKEELTTAIGLSMVFTSVMMVALPALIKALEMPEVLGGAWIGGTVDATGAVVAAGAFLGDTALNVAATIKMIQNILIGVIAFGVAVYWATKVEKKEGQKVSKLEIWNRFPKFILGFIGASILFSILQQVLSSEDSVSMIEKGVFSFSKSMRGWLFALSFVSIGLSTNFKELKSHFHGGKPLILYVCGQLLNLGLTLLMAWIMFYQVFPEITESL
ncbi:YeiH family protein [Marinoscillum pacificum]|uniref:YeiH family protein n=1 Tax=Marinoscillum pacificum TaxID=392723 RepID=UPI002157E6D2|nr:YeiH family protein [Marinoscillum pacificum]